MQQRFLRYLVCPACKASTLTIHRLSGTKDLGDGILLCSKCASWFLVENGIPELVKESINFDRKLKFFEKHNLSRFRFPLRSPSQRGASRGEINQKKSQMRFFDAFSRDYVLERHSFWKAYYTAFFEEFLPQIPVDSVILDLGCGTGLGSLPFLHSSYTVIGVDISREMLQKAVARVPASQYGRHLFMVADAENLPFRQDAFDVCIGMGILHHVYSVHGVVRSVSCCLRKGGIYLGHENNKTIFRPLFDFLMKLCALWHEEAGKDQLFSARDLERYFSHYEVHSRSHVFLPPHLFNFFPQRIAKNLLQFTDSMCYRIPLLRNQGGTIVFDARKIS